MPQTFTNTGFRNQEIGYQLQGWSRAMDAAGGGGLLSTGYVLPDGARRSPDASWVLKERIRKLDRYSLDHFYHLCPDFVIELRSQSDRLTTLRRNPREWTANGVQLRWLIDPSRRAVESFVRGGNTKCARTC